MVLDLAEALLTLGLPVTGLAFIIYFRLYRSGQLDRDADKRTTRLRLKEIKAASRQRGDSGGDLIQARWMKFGGGFYGLVAMWTFVVIELGELGRFIWNFPGVESLFQAGLLDFLINAVGNQIQNFITALLWFAWWPDDDQLTVLWVLIAWIGYVLGMKLAWRTDDSWLKKSR